MHAIRVRDTVWVAKEEGVLTTVSCNLCGSAVSGLLFSVADVVVALPGSVDGIGTRKSLGEIDFRLVTLSGLVGGPVTAAHAVAASVVEGGGGGCIGSCGDDREDDVEFRLFEFITFGGRGKYGDGGVES